MGLVALTLSKYEGKIWCKFWLTDEKSPIFGHFEHSGNPFGAFYHNQTVQTTTFVYVEGIKNKKK